MKRVFFVFLRLMGTLMVIGVAIPLFSLFFVLSSMHGNAQLPADCAVVFGAAVLPLRNGSGRVVTAQAGPAILRRVETAADLYKRGLIKKIFLTGGKGEGMRLSEAEVMRRVAIENGVKPESITLESNARSTEENIAFTKPLTGSCASIIAISDDYHLSRIGLIAWKNNWKIQTYPASQSSPPLSEQWSIARELMGVIYEVLSPILGNMRVQS